MIKFQINAKSPYPLAVSLVASSRGQLTILEDQTLPFSLSIFPSSISPTATAFPFSTPTTLKTHLLELTPLLSVLSSAAGIFFSPFDSRIFVALLSFFSFFFFFDASSNSSPPITAVTSMKTTTTGYSSSLYNRNSLLRHGHTHFSHFHRHSNSIFSRGISYTVASVIATIDSDTNLPERKTRL